MKILGIGGPAAHTILVGILMPRPAANVHRIADSDVLCKYLDLREGDEVRIVAANVIRDVDVHIHTENDDDVTAICEEHNIPLFVLISPDLPIQGNALHYDYNLAAVNGLMNKAIYPVSAPSIDISRSVISSNYEIEVKDGQFHHIARKNKPEHLIEIADIYKRISAAFYRSKK